MRQMRTVALCALPAGILLSYLGSFFPLIIERYYSTGINKALISVLSLATGILPFSLAELLAILLVFIMVWKLVRMPVMLLKMKKFDLSFFLNGLVDLLGLAAIAYLVFVLLWGLNYSRSSFADIAHLTVRPAAVGELADLCSGLIDRTNRLRMELDEDGNGVMRISGGKARILNDGAAGYEQAAAIYPELGGRYGQPKGIILSELMSYLGLAGVYFPFTGEANVNMAIPDAMLPSMAAHEMAHQRGFAREDEANYIAYLTCSLNPDPDFQYSGSLLAAIKAMNMLKQYDGERYIQLQEKYSQGVRKDLKHYALFLKKHEGAAARMSNDVNDLYLKSNRQADGVYSYNRMVDLLMAEYRSGKI